MTNPIQISHESLDREEGRLLRMLGMAAKQDRKTYDMIRLDVERTFKVIDRKRVDLTRSQS